LQNLKDNYENIMGSLDQTNLMKLPYNQIGG